MQQDSPLPRLLEEISLLNTRLHELNVAHYRQVVDARDSLSRCNAISQDLQSRVEETTETALPKLRSKLLGFQDMGRKLCQQHKKTSLLIDLNSSLVDLLSIPSLMDTCARSGAVEEALELCGFASTLRVRHEAIAELNPNQHGVEIIRKVSDEVEQSAVQLRKQLLAQLRGQIDLPACLRLLSHLKRLDVTISGPSSVASLSILQQEFLDARDAFLINQTLLVQDHNDLPYQTCLKQIQKNREVWFDVITQFQAVFGPKPLLGRWIRSKIAHFVSGLQSDYLPRFDNLAEVGTVYELCSSFASGLGRIGADFRSVVQRVFLARAMEISKSAWTSAGSHAMQSLAKGEFGTQPILPAAAAGAGGDELAPSVVLLQCPVLVDFCNSMLRSFNDLRSFACLNLVGELAVELVSALDLVVKGLEQFYAAPPSSVEVQRRFQQVLDLFTNNLLGYLCKCFAAVFDWKKPLHSLVDVLGLNSRLRRMTTVASVVIPNQVVSPPAVEVVAEVVEVMPEATTTTEEVEEDGGIVAEEDIPQEKVFSPSPLPEEE